MNTLITGATGFAGRHLSAACEAAGEDVIAVSRSAADHPIDLCNAQAIRRLVRTTQPRAIYHLAAHAHVGQSWLEPTVTVHENTAMTLNLLEAVRIESPESTVLVALSGEIYGRPDSLPVDEQAPLRPQNPYALSKANCDAICAFYESVHNLHVIRARAFNHAGPGQQSHYAISSFAQQVARELINESDTVTIVTGNPNAKRDYTDVRDVVSGYRALVEASSRGAFNICSGETYSARDLIQLLTANIDRDLRHIVDEELVRPNEVMEIRGANAKIKQATTWKPTIALEQTLSDTLAWWLQTLDAAVICE